MPARAAANASRFARPRRRRLDAERATSGDVIDGIIDILRHGEGNEAARKWASGCMLSGECIKACDYGVNPRFLLYMARVAMARAEDDVPTQRRNGVEDFRKVARDVKAHFPPAARRCAAGAAGAGRPATSRRAGDEPPDFVFYTGCNVLKTPHIALLALDIMDALGITYEVMGGPTHCCGIVQMRMGDVATSGRFAENTHRQAGAQQERASAVVVPVLPGAVHRDDAADVGEDARRKAVRDDAVHAVPAQEARPAAAAVARAVPMRIALHRHPGIRGVVEAAEDILRAVPGIEIVDLQQPAVGLQSNNLQRLPDYRRELQQAELAGGRSRRHRCAGRGLSFRSSRTVRARARLAVPHHEHATRSSAPAWGCIRTTTSSG